MESLYSHLPYGVRHRNVFEWNILMNVPQLATKPTENIQVTAWKMNFIHHKALNQNITINILLS